MPRRLAPQLWLLLVLPLCGGAPCSAEAGGAASSCDAPAAPASAGEHMLLQRAAVRTGLAASSAAKEGATAALREASDEDLLALDVEQEMLGSAEDCRDGADVGSQCVAAVNWAMNVGINAHPEWYPGLPANATRAEFQDYLSIKYSFTQCPRPCTMCRTAQEGSACYNATWWAKYKGIRTNPTMFPGLNAGSTLEEFQHHFHGNNRDAYRADPDYPTPPVLQGDEVCRLYMVGTGCGWTSNRSCPGQQPVGANGTMADDNSTDYRCCCGLRLWRPVCPEPCALCRSVSKDEQCYTDIVWAMTVGIRLYPQWYPNLTSLSTFDDFQDFLTARKPCPKPCGMCGTPAPNDRCDLGVRWAMEHGVRLYPEWYPDLTDKSEYTEFQAHLHYGGFEGCPLPCTRTGAAQTFG